MVRTSSHVLIFFSLRVGGSTQGGGHMALELFVVSARTNKRHHQQVQLAQLHFRLTQVYKDSIPGTLYEITMSRFQDLPPQAMERLMKQAQNHLHQQPALHPPQSQSGPPGKQREIV